MTLRPFLDTTNNSIVTLHVESANLERYVLLDALPTANMGNVDTAGKPVEVASDNSAAEIIKQREEAVVAEAIAKNHTKKTTK